MKGGRYDTESEEKYEEVTEQQLDEEEEKKSVL